MALALAAAGLQIAGGISSYQQARRQHRYRLQVARARAKYGRDVSYNLAVLAEQEAADTLRSGEKARKLLGRKAAHTIAGIRAGMASSGFTVGGGDAYKLEADVHHLAREDRNELRRQTHRRADLLRYRADMIRHSADYNLKMASHDPGGPSFGAYFLRSLAGAAGAYHTMGGQLPSFNFGFGQAPRPAYYGMSFGEGGRT